VVSFVRRLLNVYPGEGKRALLFVLLAYVWALGISSGNKFSDALFLLQIGPESLPKAYFITSCGLLAAASFLIMALNRALPHTIFPTVIGVDMMFYVWNAFSIWTGIGFDTLFFWFQFKIISYILFVITLTCFWVYVDQYYHIQDAKRLFTLFNAAVFMGDATTGILMRLQVFVLDTLMIYILLSLFAALLLVSYITRKTQPVSDDMLVDEGAWGEHRSFMYLFRSALSSRFTLLLMSFNLLMQLLIVITEFNYFTTFTRKFGEAGAVQMEEGMTSYLTSFLGQWVAAVGVFNLLMGLFIYSRLVRRFGISNLVLATPLLLLVAFSGWLTSDSLLFPLMGFFAVEGTLYTIDDSNFTLLLNAVPSRVKYKIRVIIESFFEPAGMLVSSILLTISATYSKMLGLFLVIVWLVVALGLRSEYLNALFSNLWGNAVHLGRSASRWLASLRPKVRESAEHRLLAILRQGSEEEQMFACEGLIAFEDGKILKKMLQYADKMSPLAKVHFLQLIERSPFALDPNVLDHIQAWSYEEHYLKLKSMVNFYLAKRGLLHPDKAVLDLESGHPELVGAAVVALKNSQAHLSPSSAVLNRTLASQKLDELLKSDELEKKCIGIRVLGCEPNSSNVEILLPLLRDPAIPIAREAAASLSKIINKQFARYAPQLISLLSLTSDSEFRLSCLEAISKIVDSTLVRSLISVSSHFRANERQKVEDVIFKMGLRTVPVLLSITKDTSMHDRSRIIGGRILGRLALPQLHANLYEIVHKEIERARFYYLQYLNVQQKVAKPQFETEPKLLPSDSNVLRDTLKSGYYSVLEFMIQLLGIAGSIEDSETLYRAIRSPSVKVRGEAVEALEKTCDPKIFRLLYPLVSDIPFEEKLRFLNQTPPLSLTDLLDKMDDSSSQADRIMAATLKYRLNLPNWRETLRRQMATNEELFHHFAYELLET